MAIVGLAGFPLANTFFTGAPRMAGSWAAGSVGVGRRAGVGTGACRARQEGVAMMSYQGGGWVGVLERVW